MTKLAKMKVDLSTIKFSVIIPTLNEADNIGELLELLIPQLDFNVDEIIVVDANSLDKTNEIATSFGVRVISCLQKSRAFQMNLGAKEAKGNLFYFVHADARPPKSFRTDIMEALSNDYVIGCYRFKFDSNKWLLALNSYFTRFDRLMCRGGDQTLFVSKELFEKLGGYQENYRIMEDYDFIIRARKENAFKILPKNVIVSSRKYKHNSYLRVNIANLIVFTLFGFGAKQKNMIKAYSILLNHPKAESLR